MKATIIRMSNFTLANLHSNMDRFERRQWRLFREQQIYIYIPIWIDLKESPHVVIVGNDTDLHSNMDRFERPMTATEYRSLTAFTFQYG